METKENDQQADGDPERDLPETPEEDAETTAGGPMPVRETIASPSQPAVPPPEKASSWLPEALSIAAVIFSAASLLGTRLAQNLAVVTAGAEGQLGVYKRIIYGDGGTALLGVLLAIAALVAAGPTAKPWARSLSVAALILGGVAVIVSGVTFGLMPEPQPQPPGLG